MNIYQEIKSRFPPSSTNNSRSIVRGIVDYASKHPSDMKMQEIEKELGFTADHSDSDWGNEPKALQE